MLKARIAKYRHGVKDAFARLFESTLDRDSLNQQLQRQIIAQYELSRLTGAKPYLRIADAGFRCYSQFEEDGIILYVLAMIGTRSRKVVEMCCGPGNECMATN